MASGRRWVVRDRYGNDIYTHIIAIVLFRFSEGPDGEPVPNSYIVTAYQKEIG